jgi:putative ATPase
MSLFDGTPLGGPPEPGEDDTEGRPLADRMRQRSLEEYLGQEHILAPGKALRTQIEYGHLTSLILWGPPGSGKTTLAALMAQRAGSAFVRFSAVLSGIKEIKSVMAEAERARRLGHKTVLFIDEIHRLAGCVFALRRARRRHIDWRHDGKSFIRSKLRAPIPY